MKKRVVLIFSILVLLLTGCGGSEWTNTELCIITPSGRTIKCDLMEEEDLLKIEGTEEYQFTLDKEDKLLYIENKEGEQIFTQKKVTSSNHKSYRGSMNSDGTLWICMEKWDIGGFYVGGFRRGYLYGMPVETELWKIDPESGEVLFHEKEELFYVTHTDEWVYFYEYGFKTYKNNKWISKEARMLRRSIEDWDNLEVVKEMGHTELPANTYRLNFEISEDSIIVTGTGEKDSVTLEAITITLED